MESIRLEKIEIDKTMVKYFFHTSEKLKKYFKEDKYMFINYDENVEDIPKSILTIPFVSLILPIIWSTNSILWIMRSGLN